MGEVRLGAGAVRPSSGEAPAGGARPVAGEAITEPVLTGEVRLSAVAGLPEIEPGADLAALIVEAAGDRLVPGTVVCVAHKLVSKAEGRVVDLATVEPTPAVALLAASSGRDPRHAQVILDEASEVIRAERGILICRTHHGFVCANAGVDLSNAGPGTAPGRRDGTDDRASGDQRSIEGDDRPATDAPETGPWAVLLPVDPDVSARRLRDAIQRTAGVAPIAVLISDSFGRAWRIGQVDVAIGLAGLTTTVPPGDGRADRDGRTLAASEPAVADELAAAAGLARTKAGGQGVVLAHGLPQHVHAADGPGAAALLRARHEDLFGARNADDAAPPVAG